MTFNQAQETFRTDKTYETAYTYLVIASQRKADEPLGSDTFFNAVGEVASWLSASDEHLLGFETAKATATTWARNEPAWSAARASPGMRERTRIVGDNLRPYLPSWIKDERIEFALEVLATLALVISAMWLMI